MQNEKFLTARWIGKSHGMSSHKVNLLLFENGYLSANKVPTAKAKGFAQQYRLDCGLFAYKWDRDFVSRLIEKDTKPEPAPKAKRG